MLKLRDSKLKDDVLLEQFYDKIIETYEYGENYLILLIHGMYDVRARPQIMRRCSTPPTRYVNICSAPSVGEPVQGGLKLRCGE